jgi:uncharacterized protein YjbJ (UPF0337 family)
MVVIGDGVRPGTTRGRRGAGATDSNACLRPVGRGRRITEANERTDMSAGEKAKAKAERLVGKAVRKAAHAVGNETTAAKGAALEARGTARSAKEKSKHGFWH